MSLLLVGLSFASLDGCRRRLLSAGEKCTAGDANCLCDTSGDCRITASDGSGQTGPGGKCIPTTCEAQGATCGEIPDTCGRTLRCGACDSPLVCDLTTHTCGDCRATTCAAKNKQCGTISDGCGGLLNCDTEAGGGCGGTQTCGGAGIPNECGCTPKTCNELGATCGTRDDGCGGTVDCDVQVGGCPPAQNCDPTTNSCFIPNCTPKTCTELGNPCGPVSDGCGRTISCSAGKCSASGQLCDPESHQCVTYNPDNGTLGKGTVACGDRQCGAFDDACHVSHTCGGAAENGNCGGGGQPACPCTPGQVCRGNLCKACVPLGSCPPGTCGAVSNGCGGVLDCGTTSAAGANGGGKCDIRGQVCDDILTRCLDPHPTNCAAEGKNCGYIFDGQGNQIFCGNCTAPETCGGDGRGGVCGLKPGVKACLDVQAECGQVQDSCGNPYLCGTCASNRRCQTDNSCIDCVTEDYRTCEQIQVGGEPRKCGNTLDKNCGLNDLNCDCSSVGPRYSCSTSTPNTIGECICTPNVTCASANACNTTLPDDGCGFPVTCGGCAGGNACNEANKTCCAANAPYNADTGACCNANATVNGSAPSRICCDSGRAYNPDVNQCCGAGQVLNGTPGTQICCIANRYNPTNNSCCAGEYNDVTASCCAAGQSETNGICCTTGDTGNPDTGTCCTGGFTPQGTVGSRICCTAGRHNIDPTPDVCCPSGEVATGTVGSRICCTAGRYDNEDNTCCASGQHASGTAADVNEICCSDSPLTNSAIVTPDGNRQCCPAGQAASDLPGAPTTDTMCCPTGQSAKRRWNDPTGTTFPAICCANGANTVNHNGACCGDDRCAGQCSGTDSACGGAFPSITCTLANCGGGQVCNVTACCTPATCGNRCDADGTITDNCGGTVSGCNCGGNPTECNLNTSTCCTAGRPYNAATSACCGAGLTLFGSPTVCCTAARFNTATNTCCAGPVNVDAAPDVCCASGQVLAGSAPNRICCASGQSNIGGICCANATDHNVAGACCVDSKFNPASGGSCCAGPYNSTTAQCCASGESLSSDSGTTICCGPGKVNKNGICCAASEHNDAGICCGPGKHKVGSSGLCCAGATDIDFGGTCCAPPTDAECSSSSSSAGLCNTTISRCGTQITCDPGCAGSDTCVGTSCCGSNVCGARICGGPYTNACGNVSPVCGSCAANQACTNGGLCCKALTCAVSGHTCGQDTDGCGGLVTCGSCTGPKVCGSYGANNQKCCTPIDVSNAQVCPCGTQKLDTCTGQIVNCNGCGSTGG